MDYKIILTTDKGATTFHYSAHSAKHAVTSLVHSGRITFKPPIYGKVYPKKGIKILEFVILFDKDGRKKVSYVDSPPPHKFKFSYKIEREKFLEDAENKNRYYILLTGIDLKYHGTYKTFVIMKDEAKRLYDSGKRVTIIAIPERYNVTKINPFTIDHEPLEKWLKTSVVKAIPFKIERYLE